MSIKKTGEQELSFVSYDQLSPARQAEIDNAYQKWVSNNMGEESLSDLLPKVKSFLSSLTDDEISDSGKQVLLEKILRNPQGKGRLKRIIENVFYPQESENISIPTEITNHPRIAKEDVSAATLLYDAILNSPDYILSVIYRSGTTDAVKKALKSIRSNQADRIHLKLINYVNDIAHEKIENLNLLSK